VKIIRKNEAKRQKDKKKYRRKIEAEQKERECYESVKEKGSAKLRTRKREM
jgi:hypothetical protein